MFFRSKTSLVPSRLSRKDGWFERDPIHKLRMRHARESTPPSTALPTPHRGHYSPHSSDSSTSTEQHKIDRGVDQPPSLPVTGSSWLLYSFTGSRKLPQTRHWASSGERIHEPDWSQISACVLATYRFHRLFPKKRQLQRRSESVPGERIHIY